MLNVYNPYSGKVIETLPLFSYPEIDVLLEKANKIKDSKNYLSKVKRIEILKRFADLLIKNESSLIKIAISEGGKPLKDTKVEFDRAVNGVEIAISEIANINGEQIPLGHTSSSENRISYSVKEPIGVVLAISAFNHPINLIIHQVIPAIATGCPVIVKPALKTPLSCKLLIELLYQSGLEKDYCQLLICEDELTQKLVSDSRIDFMSFIGSDKVGWKLKSLLAPGTRCALELGGIGSVIIAEDGKLEKAISPIIKAGYYHSGQVCVSVQKVFVHKSLVNDFLVKMNAEIEKLKVGNPEEKDTDIGPLITKDAQSKMIDWIEDAQNKKGKIICGGKALENNCFSPTLILRPNIDAFVSSKEVFGPIISVYSFDKIEEAIEMANASEYEFQAATFTESIDNSVKLSKELNASTVMINDHTAFRVDWMPFGGHGISGYNTGGIKYTMNDYLKNKLVVIKSN